MTIVVFAEPSLHPEDRQEHPGIEFRPPLRPDDLTALIEDDFPSRRIGIIDGDHGTDPAVIIEEMRGLLDHGSAVYGAAGLGALLAAQLHEEGVIGIGTVFDWYRDRTISGADEIAVATTPGTFQPGSVPLVDIRHTLHAAYLAEYLSPFAQPAILDIAQALRYTERTWDRILQDAGRLPKIAPSLPLLQQFLDSPQHPHLTREDALALLERITES